MLVEEIPGEYIAIDTQSSTAAERLAAVGVVVVMRCETGGAATLLYSGAVSAA